MPSILDLAKKKAAQEKLSMVTCYDATFAKILNRSDVDMLLVGDSLAMVIYGDDTTLKAEVDVMARHAEAVVKAAPGKFVVCDMPFLSYRKDLKSNVDAVHRIMQSGCHAIKIEGAEGNLEFVRHMVASGVPVMGHLGLTPQSIHQLGGFKVQGKDPNVADKIFHQARDLEEAGCFSLVLECVPTKLAHRITSNLSIPTIGIGAGTECDGQVLVLHDLLGLNEGFRPKFLRKFMNGHDLVLAAVNDFDKSVKRELYPTHEESYDL